MEVVPLPCLDHIPTVKVPLSSLIASESPRRSGESLAHAKTLAQSEDRLPPIVVQRATMRIIDGMHRVRAAEIRGEGEIEVRFVDGDEESAFVLAVSENTKHGLPLSSADRKAAAARIIDSYPQWSDRMIASVTGLSGKTVAMTRQRQADGRRPDRLLATVGRDGRIRPRDTAQRRELARKLMMENPDSSLRKIARLVGISPETARDVRRRLIHESESLQAGQERCDEGTGSVTRGKLTSGRTGDAGNAASGAIAIQALRSDPAFRSTESGRSLLRMLAAYQVLRDHGDQLIESVPMHCLDRVAVAAQACGREWDDLAKHLKQRSRALSKDDRTA